MFNPPVRKTPFPFLSFAVVEKNKFEGNLKNITEIKYCDTCFKKMVLFDNFFLFIFMPKTKRNIYSTFNKGI